ncbi:hypothetical protein K443DRAFT_671974 [Laccaria amethystina LaAM-08-1]|uniref:MMS19 nucleotide excision repair protein n=1 Tax=Laccaria amethystina LaAM-08-1 TaxID=1095629 RepID=A0A0C9Y4P0_9AGAR|nr:hypothetical protein K443DRAFT_671974 [Laccaria amethystina LaAM-08-1]
MESTERLVRTWMASGRDEEIGEIVSDISNDRTTLIVIVKALGEYLTSEENDLRRKGVELLSLVLEKCPPARLTRQSIRVLTPFYCGKLDDSETIVPALQGILTLVKLPTFGAPEATGVIDALFLYVKTKSLVQSVRFNVYSIIDSLMARHRDALKALGKKFVGNYIALAEGEKDPRNLVVAFAIARVILIEFDISEYVESLFNITFCYFPITFRPPPNDPYGISSDDLRAALRQCLCATPLFGPLAIPVFLEKLTAGSRATKKDTLQALATCLPIFGSALARATARKLWSALKLEIFQPMDSNIEEEALKTTQILVKTIYHEEEAAHEHSEDIAGLARDACEECIQILREPEKSMAKPATKVICAFMATTPSVSRYTVSLAVPHFVKLFLNPDEAANRAPILHLLSDIVNAARDSVAGNVAEDVPLMPYKDEVLGVFSVGLKASSSRLPTLSGLKGLITTKTLLSDEELGFIVHNVDEIIEGGTDALEESSDEILDLLTTIASIAPHHIEEQTLPLLFRMLPDVAFSRDAIKERANCWRTLSALQTLCVQPELFETLVIRLTTKLDLVCFPANGARVEIVDTEPNAAYAHSILTTISNTLSTKVEKSHPDVGKYIERLVPHIYNLFIFSAFGSDEQRLLASDLRLVHVAGKIISLVVQTLPPQRQTTFSIELFKALLDGQVKGVSQGHQKIPSDRKFDVLNETTQKNLLPLFTAAITSLHKEVPLPVVDLGRFLDSILTWTLLQADNGPQRTSALQMVSSIVNKKVDELSSFLSDKLDVYWPQEVGDVTRPAESRHRAIQSWLWMSKALIVRNHPLALSFSERLFQVFDDEAVGWDAAKACGEIPGTDTILTKRNHAVIKILYSQKYVNTILPRLMEGAKSSSKSNEQAAYLVALTSLIKSTPKGTYVHEMPLLIPLLLQSLDLPDANIRCNVIGTFLAVAEGETPSKSLVSEHSSTLVTSMLKNSMVSEMPTTKVRVFALQYLGLLPNIVRYDVLHPQKPLVLRELAKVLDDPKRTVRKEAVNARTNWFKYNG